MADMIDMGIDLKVSGLATITKDCVYFKPYMKYLSSLVHRFYEMRNCVAGGPLHILLDDNNYDIDSVQFCMNYCFECLQQDYEEYDRETYVLGIMICNEYAKMSLEERAIFDAYLSGERIVCKQVWNCSGCEILCELYEEMKEQEDAYD